ncbi:hypothetical protein BJ165DRAFT_768945 [Panaeolus papilionaceus]|nr:hypothetical protein BJ165DRAFT_768945 [Panaeolus papilionaceus]
MMVRQSFFFSLMLPILAAASPTVVDDPAGISLAKRGSEEGLETIERRQYTYTTCGSLHLLCCNTYGYASDYNIAPILALLGVSIGGTYKVGLTCTPISILGGVSSTCTAQPLCCWWGAEYNYLVAIDCWPVDMSL